MKHLTTILLLLIIAGGVSAATLQDDRQYEAAIFPYYQLGYIADAPVDEIYVFAYSNATGSWSLIPFQIDEQVYGPDPYSSSKGEKWFYFAELPHQADPENYPEQHDGIFNGHDELVFLYRDAGDQAPANSWPNIDGIKDYDRLELRLYDQQDESIEGWVYVYRTNQLTRQDIPRPYEMAFDENTNILSSKYYEFGFSQPALVENITIKQPYGSGENILDRLKVRIDGVINYFLIIEGPFTEDLLFGSGLYYTQDPIVRLIREMKFNFKVRGATIPGRQFLLDTHFFPFHGTIAGGDTLTLENLQDHQVDTGEIRISDWRFSWDFNENANGMNFFSQYNQNIPVDGMPEKIDETIDLPVSSQERIQYWGLTSGDQGSVFTSGGFVNSKWDTVRMYYWDQKNNPDNLTGDYYLFNDYTLSEEGDSGDGKAFGEYGLLFRESQSDTVILQLNFEAYMIPEKNLDQAFGQKLADHLLNPISISKSIQTKVEDEAQPNVPNQFNLFQNYPNPFNNSTYFSFELPTAGNGSLNIYNATGQLVSTLGNQYYAAGTHRVHWSGVNMAGESLSSGIYFYQLEFGNAVQRQKLVLIR